MRIVLDTNVVISVLLVPASPPGAVLRHWRAGVFDVVVSEALLTEMRGVAARPRLRGRHRLTDEELAQFFATMRRDGILVLPRDPAAVVTADPTDNKVLECAVAGNADIIVSGDKKHLLPLGSYDGIPIVAPAAFLAMLETDNGNVR